MFWNILINENIKILRRRLFWVEIILLVLIVVGILLALFITVETERNGSGLLSEERRMLLETLTWPEAWNNVIRLAGWDGFGPVFLIILVGAVTAQEYTWRTLHLPLSRGISRPMLLMAKFAVLLIAGALIVLTVLVAGGITTAIFSTLINGSLNLRQLDMLHMSLSIVRATYTLLPYGCLALFLAVASRSTVVAISGGLVFTLVLENLIISGAGMLGERFANLVLYLPGGLANSLLALNNASLGMGNTSEMTIVSPLHAVIGIAAWAVLFLILSLVVFQRQDLTA
jgi:ABC-type transport system involved in multi-copper enzyme maturation permease subunit